jgi:hypothetical protein
MLIKMLWEKTKNKQKRTKGKHGQRIKENYERHVI